MTAHQTHIYPKATVTESGKEMKRSITSNHLKILRKAFPKDVLLAEIGKGRYPTSFAEESGTSSASILALCEFYEIEWPTQVKRKPWEVKNGTTTQPHDLRQVAKAVLTLVQDDESLQEIFLNKSMITLIQRAAVSTGFRTMIRGLIKEDKEIRDYLVKTTRELLEDWVGQP